MRALSLSDYQLAQLRAAAKTLLPSARSNFPEGVARRLDDQPSDEALQIVIAAQLPMNGLPVFLCDGNQKRAHLGITSQ
jgi:hypothetical protein